MTNAQIIKAFKNLLDYANHYSDTMAEKGMGATQLGSNVSSDSIGGMARAAIKSLEDAEAAKVNRGKCQVYVREAVPGEYSKAGRSQADEQVDGI